MNYVTMKAQFVRKNELAVDQVLAKVKLVEEV
jgi:hypothetical protein